MEQTIILFYGKAMCMLKIHRKEDMICRTNLSHRKQDMICRTNLGTFLSNFNMIYTSLIMRYKQEL